MKTKDIKRVKVKLNLAPHKSKVLIDGKDIPVQEINITQKANELLTINLKCLGKEVTFNDFAHSKEYEEFYKKVKQLKETKHEKR